jgi:hypothetical protein
MPRTADVVELLLRAKDQLSRVVDRSAASFDRLKARAKLAAVAGAAALAGLAFKAIQAASAFEETESKFKAVFKGEAERVRGELEAIGDEINRSARSMMGYASTLQDTFVPLGFAREEAADLSVQVVQLSQDLASFNNLPTQQVIMDIQSALVGNTETLRKYGVVAQETEIKQYALNEGLWDGEGALTAQEKAAAILGITLASTTDAQGDAARTADSFANQMRGLRDEINDLLIELGQKLIPVVKDSIPEIREMAQEFSDVAEVAIPKLMSAMQDLLPITVDVAAKILDVVAAASELADFAWTGEVDIAERALSRLADTLEERVAGGHLTAEEAQRQFSQALEEATEDAYTLQDAWEDRSWLDALTLGNTLAGRAIASVGDESSLTEEQFGRLRERMEGFEDAEVTGAFNRVTGALQEMLGPLADIQDKFGSVIAAVFGEGEESERADEAIADARELKTIIEQYPEALDKANLNQLALTEEEKQAMVQYLNQLQQTERSMQQERRTAKEEEYALQQEILDKAREAREEEMAHLDRARAKQEQAAAEFEQRLSSINSWVMGIGQGMSNAFARDGVEGLQAWGEQFKQMLIQIVAMAAFQLVLRLVSGGALGTGGPLSMFGLNAGGIPGLQGSRKAQAGITVPDFGQMGDRYPVILSRGEIVQPREDVQATRAQRVHEQLVAEAMGKSGGVNLTIISRHPILTEGELARIGTAIRRFS